MSIRSYVNRRVQAMRRMGKNSVAIIPTAGVAQRNQDVDFPFRADSDFYYLTGFLEPESVAVLLTGKKRADDRFILFCRDRDPDQEIWHGRRHGTQAARRVIGADECFPIEQLDNKLPAYLSGRERIFYTMGKHAKFDEKVLSWRNQVARRARAGVSAPDELVAIESIVHDMRLRKSREEIALMRHAARISAGAHRRAMQVCAPGMMEYERHAELLHEFMRHGCRSPAYPSIVGGGENGCILHYTENNASLRDGDLLLIDAGAEYQGYAADITRTFPVNGRFSKAQRAIYDLVLKAQYAAIAQIKPGHRFNNPHDAAVRVLTRGLVELGLLKGKTTKLIKEGAYRRFYMHRTGHWLGMDVHDVGNYMVDGKWRVLEPGMVMTVEPGLYIPAASKRVAKQWWDIAVRIEDDVVVTKQGCEVLTRDVPKEADAIEALMARV